MFALSSLLLVLATTGLAHPSLSERDGTTAVVNFSNNTGTPKHLASGILYGLPDTPNQIPSQFYTDMGFNYARAGGAQVGAPGRGWIWGVDEYKVSRNTDETDVRTVSLPSFPITRLLDSTTRLSSSSHTTCGAQTPRRTARLRTPGTMAIGPTTTRT